MTKTYEKTELIPNERKNREAVSSSKSRQEVAVITGASSGFGLSTLRLLAKEGYKVYGTSRHPNKANWDYTENSELLELDVNSDQSVDAFVVEVLKRSGGRIDVLVNNAGYVGIGALEEMSIDEAKMQFETNLFGVMRMVNAVLPVMRGQKSGHIVNLGSIVGRIPVPFSGLYSASKFALEGYTEQLRLETKNLGIKVSVVEPGYFRTNLLNASKFASKNIDAYKEVRRRANAVLQKREENGEDPILVARTILKIIKSDKPALRHPVGKDKSALRYMRIFPQSSFEKQIGRIFDLNMR